MVKDDFPNIESCEKALHEVSVLVPLGLFGKGNARYECRPKEEVRQQEKDQ
jgi:hypothetical protein